MHLSKEGEDSGGDGSSDTNGSRNSSAGGGRGGGGIGLVGGAAGRGSGGGGLDTRLGDLKDLGLGELAGVLFLDGNELEAVLVAGLGNKVLELVLFVFGRDLLDEGY